MSGPRRGTVLATPVGLLPNPRQKPHCSRCGIVLNKPRSVSAYCRDCDSVVRLMASPTKMRRVMAMNLDADDVPAA